MTIMTSYRKKNPEMIKNDVIIISDSMLNNVNCHGLLKSKKVEVLNFPGATTSDIANRMDDILVDKPQSLILHVGTNDLTNDLNFLNNVKKLSIKLKRNHPTLHYLFLILSFERTEKIWKNLALI